MCQATHDSAPSERGAGVAGVDPRGLIEGSEMEWERNTGSVQGYVAEME